MVPTVFAELTHRWSFNDAAGPAAAGVETAVSAVPGAEPRRFFRVILSTS